MKLPALELDHLLMQAGLTSEAEDCSIVPISETHFLISNIDIVTPIHDDPKIMGKIAACNATNDLFALNATEVLNFNCFLGLPIDIPEEEAVEILMGIKEFLGEIGAKVNGGHTIQSDVPLMGGSTSAMIDKKHIIGKQGVKDGDRLLITKPLGIQTIMAADRTIKREPSLLEGYDFKKIKKGIAMAEKMMTTSNRPIPQLIHKHNMFNAIHAMTDITGFGFQRHLEEMLLNSGLGACIEKLPAIIYTPILEDLLCYGIDEGKSSEIAGAMLISIDQEHFDQFTKLMNQEKIWWMEVGNITASKHDVEKTRDFHLVEVKEYW